MSKRKIVTAVNNNKKNSKDANDFPQASIESQTRLAEILADSPRLVSLNGTEWEVRALRMGTQYLIAKKCLEINKAKSATFGDVINEFSTNAKAIVEVITLALLNSKEKIFKNSDESQGYSELYKATYDTLMWDCNVEDFAQILFEVLEMTNTDFFFKALDMLQIFRASVTEKKRARTIRQK